ncbi:hypothetical protein CMUS01_09986 [Colletotrichum musicola]|uniref:Uncharacterized protein n=1 Tax=Colletotrichum musicola TaxID=2175873 RepID=A0A8H6NA48_9PEZI|nr:hypothetical protein CMUS01_09986 [Colletotrichum musicola]
MIPSKIPSSSHLNLATFFVPALALRPEFSKAVLKQTEAKMNINTNSPYFPPPPGPKLLLRLRDPFCRLRTRLSLLDTQPLLKDTVEEVCRNTQSTAQPPSLHNSVRHI